ncbi:MAG TPA: NFACT family protein [Candidatus Nanoarchaeia archaeon]|nr:NFACT family protein [Candidatus Nanoarchaeia archaeon]
MELSALDLKYLLAELQTLVHAKINRIFQPRKEEIVFQLHSTAKGKQFLRVVPGYAAFLALEKPESPEQPSSYCMQLRKLLEGGVIRTIILVPGERIIACTIGLGTDTRTIYIELFGKGNLVIVDDHNSILSVFQVQAMRDRTIRPKEQYVLPPARPQLVDATQQEFIEQVTGNGPIARKLALLGLGGAVAEEVCARADIPALAPRITQAQAEALYAGLHGLLAQAPAPRIILENNAPILALPVHFMRFADRSQQATASFSAAIATVIDHIVHAQPLQAPRKKITKLQTIIRMQNEQLQILEQEAIEEQRKGELLYEQYSEMKPLLTELQTAFRKKELKPHGRISAVDLKHGTATVKLA